MIRNPHPLLVAVPLLFAAFIAGSLKAQEEATPVAGTAPAPAPEPLCAIVQPALMKSEIARPFAGSRGTFLVPASEGEFGLTMLSQDQFQALGISWDAFILKAKSAASRLLDATRAEFIRNDRKEITHAILRSDRHHLPSVIFAPEFVDRFRDSLGSRLVVVMPNHFTVYVFSRNFGPYRDFGPAALEEYGRSLWPCSREVFEVTADGVQCLGAFDDGLSAPSTQSAAQPAPRTAPAPAAPPPPKPAAKPSARPQKSPAKPSRR